MSWWGKVVGGACGFAFGGPWGAVVGTVLGHGVDYRRRYRAVRRDPQQEFMTTLFAVMGHVAKADGRVSEQEINAARQVMIRLGLNEEQQRAAVGLFNWGKQPDFELDDTLQRFRYACRQRRDLSLMLLENLLAVALADGSVHPAQHRLLVDIGRRLGIPRALLGRLVSMLRAQQSYNGQAAPSGGQELRTAYAVLGVDRRASTQEIKRAYRRLMSQHHPDKLAAQGLSEDMMRMANERAQRIRGAYDQVMAARDQRAS